MRFSGSTRQCQGTSGRARLLPSRARGRRLRLSRSFVLPKLLTLAVLAGCADPAGEAIRTLDEGETQARRSAARTLAEDEPRETTAIPALIRSLDDPDPEVRRVSAYALGLRGADARGAISKLRLALIDEDGSVRLTAAYALARIDPHDPAPLSVLMDVARSGDARAIITLGQMGPAAEAAVPALVESLKAPSSLVRAKSAEALGKIGTQSREASAALRARRADPDQGVRDAAERALAALESAP